MPLSLLCLIVVALLLQVPLSVIAQLYYIHATNICQVFFKEKEIKLISGLA